MKAELITRLAHESGALNCRSGVTPWMRTFARLVSEECAKAVEKTIETRWPTPTGTYSDGDSALMTEAYGCASVVRGALE